MVNWFDSLRVQRHQQSSHLQSTPLSTLRHGSRVDSCRVAYHQGKVRSKPRHGFTRVQQYYVYQYDNYITYIYPNCYILNFTSQSNIHVRFIRWENITGIWLQVLKKVKYP